MMQKFHSFFSPSSLLKNSMVLLTLMIFLLILIGGLTRLTGSGLSIVEWNPVMGILPPLSLKEWQRVFADYQSSPEFQLLNPTMTLSDFKSIFWMEYVHRLLARLLAVFLLIPTVLLGRSKKYRSLWPLFALLWGLGLCQGLMGWLMVKSGLIAVPYVSPYRLAAHLFLGFLIFGLSLWGTFSVYPLPSLKIPPQKAHLQRNLLYSILGAVLCTAILGAFVAGLKAGLLYPTFPLMGESLIPKEVFQNVWDPASLQFFHRAFACLTLLLSLSLWVFQRSLPLPPSLHKGGRCIVLLALIQISLGIITLLQGLPWFPALMHQGFAFVLFGSVLYTLFLLRSQPIDNP